jgi:hypothetical protein
MGDLLRNDRNTKLAGCRKLKLREAGIRIVYRVLAEQVEVLDIALDVVMVLAIEKRDDYQVYQIAQDRLQKSAGMKSDDYNTAVQQTLETFQKMSDRFKNKS